jgi:diguanylate cyclase (GGDEF)-like protein
VVEVFSPSQACVGAEDVTTLHALCDVIALAMSNHQLLTERDRRLQIQQTLFDLSQAVVSVLDVDELIPKIVRNAVNLVGGASGCVGMWDEARGVLSIRAPFNCPRSLLEPGPDVKERLFRQVIRDGKPSLLDGSSEVSRLDAWLGQGEITSAVGVPLRQDKRVTGVLLVSTNRPNVHFNWEDAGLLEAFADLAAIAMANARLFRQINLKADQMDALLKISRRLTESLKLESVLNAVLKEATVFIRADAGLVHLAQHNGLEYRPVALFGPIKEMTSRLSVPLEQIIRTAVTKGEPVKVNAGPLVISVPLMAGTKRVGALTCVAGSDQSFTDDDVTFLWTLASHATVAIENARLHEETREQSIRDALTGLYNVRRLRDALAEEMQRTDRYGHELSFLMIDIDHFKQFNDTFGHQQGDIVLQSVATIVGSSLRSIDQVFRYGGEELCVLLPETSKSQALLVAERIRAAVAGFSFQSDRGASLGKVTVSIGLASAPADAKMQEDLIARADEALYRAKAAGRNRVHVYGSAGIAATR